jgi:hypothetical protein
MAKPKRKTEERLKIRRRDYSAGKNNSTKLPGSQNRHKTAPSPR